MNLEELKQAIVKDLNSDQYPFSLKIVRNTIVVKWKPESISQEEDREELKKFCIKYKLRKDGTFSGGEIKLNRTKYGHATETVKTTYYSASPVDENPIWRKRVKVEDRAQIGHDIDKLSSIIEHYLMDHGFKYKPGVWNCVYMSKEEGTQFREVGFLFMIVSCWLFVGLLNIGLIALEVIIALFFLVGLWMLLIGVGKLPFCHLRNDLFVKVFVVFFIAIWGIFFVIVFLDSKGIKILP